MPQLPNKKRELFCQYYASPGTTQSEAYTLAGYTASSSNASNLANTPEVKQRIKEIKDEKERDEIEFKLKLKAAGINPNEPEAGVQIREWNANRVREMLATNAQMAQVTGDFKTAQTSIELIGKSLDMFETKGTPNAGKSPRPEISLTVINEATGGASDGDGQLLVAGNNPLAPRLPSPYEVEREQ